MILKAHIAKRACAVLEWMARDDGSTDPRPMMDEAERLLPYFQGTRRKPQKKLPKPLRSRKDIKRAAYAASTKEIRAAVMKRAGGYCEAGICRNRATQMDHWLGGSGRRRERQSVETCWALCERDHRYRTRNTPSAAFWNNLFRLHCMARGYPFTPHVEHAPVPARSAT